MGFDELVPADWVERRAIQANDAAVRDKVNPPAVSFVEYAMAYMSRHHVHTQLQLLFYVSLRSNALWFAYVHTLRALTPKQRGESVRERQRERERTGT